MAKKLVIYNTVSGKIQGYIRVSKDSDAALYPWDPANNTALEIPYDSPAPYNQAQYKISNGQLVQKNIVQLSASAAQFPADGTSWASLTFSGLSAPATVGVGGQPVTVSPADNAITLTCDAPRFFTVQLNDADQYSNPVTVEAV